METPINELLTPLDQLHQKVHQDIQSIIDRIDQSESHLLYQLDATPLEPEALDALTRERRRRVIQQLGGVEAPAYHDKGLVRRAYATARLDFLTRFQIMSYGHLPKKLARQAFDFWRLWSPDPDLREAIQVANAGHDQGQSHPNAA